MKRIICNRPGELIYSEGEPPRSEKGRAIVKIKRIGICGTDLHAFEGTQPYFQYPRILGHELSGELLETGTGSGFHSGEAVSLIPYFSCGQCIACRKGKTNCCAFLQVAGVHTDGGMVEYLSVPEGLLLHGEGLNFDQLALIEPLAVAMHGVRRAGIRPGESVLVAGAGPIGLGVMAFAHIAGGNVIALDVNESRLGFAKEKLNITHVVNPLSGQVSERLLELTNGDMPNVVIDATGNLKAINNAFRYISHGGRYVLVGLQKGEISFSHPEFHKREATLMSSRNATRADFEKVISEVRQGNVDPLKFITHRLGFDAVVTRFESLLKPETGVIKAVVEV